MRNRRSIPASSLPPVLDCRAHRADAPAFGQLCPGDLEWDNPYAWRIEYQAVYEDDILDSCLKLRAMRGASETEAMYRLQKLLAGFGVVRIVLWHVGRPMTASQIEELRQLNLRLERIKRVERYVTEQSQRAGPGYLGRTGDASGGHSGARRQGALCAQR